MQPLNQCLLDNLALSLKLQFGLCLQYSHETAAETAKAFSHLYSDVETFLKNFSKDFDNS